MQGRRDSGVGSASAGSSSSVGIDIAKFLSSRREREASLSSACRVVETAVIFFFSISNKNDKFQFFELVLID